MNKKDRRKARHERNKQAEIDYKKGAWESGKLIEENHNSGPYSKDYTEELSKRLVGRLKTAADLAVNAEETNQFLMQANGNRNDMFINFFRRYKNKIRDLILHWSPELNRGSEYYYLKQLLEVYWDSPEVLLKRGYEKF